MYHDFGVFAWDNTPGFALLNGFPMMQRNICIQRTPFGMAIIQSIPLVETIDKDKKEGNDENRRLQLYHATDEESVKEIMKSCVMRPGTSGLNGAGIYFAETEQAAYHKANSGRGNYVRASVQVGISLVFGPGENDPQMTYWKLKKEHGCDSVKSIPTSLPEYCVYNSYQVSSITAYVDGQIYTNNY